MRRPNVRVEMTKNWCSSDREKAFKYLWRAFTRAYSDAGIGHEIKERQFFESKARKNRKNRRQAIMKIRDDQLYRRFLSGEKIPGYKPPKSMKNSDKNNDY